MELPTWRPPREASAALVLAGLLACMLPMVAIASQSLAPALVGGAIQTETGMINGRIVLPPDGRPALDLLLENVLTDVVVVVPIEPGQTTYSAAVPAGCYHAYTWLPSFDLMGGYTACEGGPPCRDHTLRDVWVEGGDSIEGVDIADWHVPETPLIVLSGRVIDGTGADPIEDGSVVLWGRHIMAVGQASELAIPPGVRHHDLPGTTILPGFINTHVHNSYRPDNLQAWAAAGVTTVRDVGAPVSLPWDSLRERFKSDSRNARILAAGPLVTCPGGYLPGLTIGMPLAEIEWMEFAGMTPMQIIVAATSDAAVVCRRQDLLGTLATGKLADVLVVEADPLTDLRALQTPRLVIHEGTIIRLEQPAPRRVRGRLQPP